VSRCLFLDTGAENPHRFYRPPKILGRYHSNRFRPIDNVFPSVAADAYDGDIARAAQDTNTQVFARVLAWEVREGREPQDWQGIGIENALIDAGYESGVLELLRRLWAKASEEQRAVFLDVVAQQRG
jgi:hypothetical protein